MAALEHPLHETELDGQTFLPLADVPTRFGKVSAFLLHLRHGVADHAPDCAGPSGFRKAARGSKVDGGTGPTASGSPVRLSPRRLFRCRQTCTGGSRGRRPPEHDNKLSPALDMIRKEGCILADSGKQRRLAFRKPRQANEVKPRDLGDPALVDGPSGLPGAPCRKDR